jgi:hypothetical protein
MSPASNRLSRWTPAMFALALANLMIALALAVFGLAWPVAPAGAPASLAMIHLLTIGWLTMLMYGALFQFVPVITSRVLPSQALSLVTLLGLEGGLALMVCGFWQLGSGGSAVALPVGGGLVIAAMVVGAASLMVPLLGKRPMPLSAKFVLAGLGFLLVTVLLGLCFALALTVPATLAVAGPLLGDGLAYHALAGFGGWFTLTAIGVSYELLPMFMLAPHERGVVGRAVLWSAVGGLILVVGAGLAGSVWSERWVGVSELAGRLVLGAALALYLGDVVRMYRGRRRRQIELHNRAAVGAFVALGLAVLLAAGAMATDRLAELTPALVLLVLLGWLTGLGLTQLYKVVAFLSWLARFGSQLGRGAVPRVQDLVDEKRGRWCFLLYFAAVLLAAGGAVLEQMALVRAALALALIAVLLLALEYARAWRGVYARRPGTASAIPGRPTLPPLGIPRKETGR